MVWATKLFNRISANAIRLGDVASTRRGIEAYKFKIAGHPSPNSLPFFEGQVKRYEITKSPAPSFVVVGIRETPFHRGSRVLTRRIVSRANRLMSALTDIEFVVKKDLYSIKLKLDDSQKAASLLALLNSSLLSFLYLSRSAAATKDDFRQVTLTGLRELPIVFPSPDLEPKLVQLVRIRERQEDNVQAVEKQIDEIVYSIYGVTSGEKHAIDIWLTRSG